jgi:hypothetical protein
VYARPVLLLVDRPVLVLWSSRGVISSNWCNDVYEMDSDRHVCSETGVERADLGVRGAGPATDLHDG